MVPAGRAGGDERGRRDPERGERGAVPECPPGDDHGGEFGERVTRVDDHHGLKAVPSRPAGLSAHPAVYRHGRLREPAEGISGVSSSSRR